MRSIEETSAALRALDQTLLRTAQTTTETEREALTRAVFKAITNKPRKSTKSNGNGHQARKAAK